MPAFDLKIGGRYAMAPKQKQKKNYEEATVAPNPESVKEYPFTLGATSPSRRYDVPKPQNKADKPPLSLKWDGAQSYEKPGCAVMLGNSKRKVSPSNTGNTVLSPDGKHANTDNDVVYANDLPQPLRKSYENVVNVSTPSSRKVSDNSVFSTQDNSSSQALNTNDSHDHLERVPPEDLHDYENVAKAGLLSAQNPPVLDTPSEASIYRNIAEGLIQVKMELKKPALPSKLFKPTAELSQIIQVTSKEQKPCKQEPLTPKGMEKKGLHEQATKGKRSQTWTFDSNVSCKTTRPSNYTQLDMATMNPHCDYEQV